MAFRMVEISVPKAYDRDARWTEEHPFLSIWEEELIDGRRLVQGFLNTEAVPQIASRSAVDLGNVALALAAGVAGALSYTRGMFGGADRGDGGGGTAAAARRVRNARELRALGAAYGAALLLVNLSSVNLAAVLTFVAQGVRPGQWYEAVRVKQATRFAIGLSVGVILVLAILLSPWEGLQ